MENNIYPQETQITEPAKEVNQEKLEIIKLALELGKLYGKFWVLTLKIHNTQTQSDKEYGLTQRAAIIETIYESLFALAFSMYYIYFDSNEYAEHIKEIKNIEKFGQDEHLFNLIGKTHILLNESGILNYGRDPTIGEILEEYYETELKPN